MTPFIKHSCYLLFVVFQMSHDVQLFVLIHIWATSISYWHALCYKCCGRNWHRLNVKRSQTCQRELQGAFGGASGAFCRIPSAVFSCRRHAHKMLLQYSWFLLLPQPKLLLDPMPFWPSLIESTLVDSAPRGTWKGDQVLRSHFEKSHFKDFHFEV